MTESISSQVEQLLEQTLNPSDSSMAYWRGVSLSDSDMSVLKTYGIRVSSPSEESIPPSCAQLFPEILAAGFVLGCFLAGLPALYAVLTLHPATRSGLSFAVPEVQAPEENGA